MTDTPRDDEPTQALERRARLPDRLSVLFLLALAVLIWLPRLNGPIDLRWDGGAYYVLGTSLAAGHGYRLLNEPGDIAETQYPPLLPAIVAAHERLLGTDDLHVVGHALRLSFFALFLLYTVAVYALVRQFLPPGHALGASLACLLSLQTYFLADLCFPETAFALVSVLFVLCGRARGVGPATAVLAAAAYALRTIGITALAAWVMESACRKQWKQTAVRLALALIPILCWNGYVRSVETSAAYAHPAYAYQRADYLFYNVSYARNVLLTDPFAPERGHITAGDAARRAASNLRGLPLSLGEAVSLTHASWEGLERATRRVGIGNVIFAFPALLGCLVLAGIGLLSARREWLLVLYIAFSLAAVCLTPWPQQFGRYLAPVAPFLALALFLALHTFHGWARRRAGRRGGRGAALLTAGLALAVLLPQGYAMAWVFRHDHQRVAYDDRAGRRVSYRLFFYFDPYRAFDRGLDWVRARARPGDVVACSMPHWAYLRTGLKSVMPPFETDPARGERLLDSVPVRYLFLDQGLALDTRRFALPVVMRSPGQWKLVYSDTVVTEKGQVIPDGFQIYRRTGAGAP